jgi:hypothetical protein
MSLHLRTRLSRLEARFGVPPVYPIAALFAADGVFLRLDMSDGSRLSGPDAALAYGELSRRFPLKVYVNFDPDWLIHPPHDPEEGPPRQESGSR